MPPPEAQPFQDAYQAVPPPPPPAQYTQAPPPPVPYGWGGLICPRCTSRDVVKAAPPMWAILLAVILAIPTCFLSLLFLLVKDPNTCRSCGLQFR